MPDASGQGGFAGVLVDVLAGVLAGPHRPSAVAARFRGWSLSRAFAQERDERRFFLWLPVAAGAGVLLYLSADVEPSPWLPSLLAAAALAAAVLLRGRPVPCGAALGVLALAAGFLSGEVRSRSVATPMLDRIRIVTLTGTVEEVDLRATGARILVAVETAEGLAPEQRPRRVRLTTRRPGSVAAGDGVRLKARLLPPARAALPGGYDFARDAFFSGIGAVGSILGPIVTLPEPAPGDAAARLHRAVDRARNALALRVYAVVGGDDTGAIAAAMVTGKRDLLSAGGREVIREAGIFHIITIAGVQMTLVAGLLFGLARRLLALSPALALRRPIKAWAAGVAIVGAVAYDIGTGSRVGTQRALFMTVIVLAAVLAGRRAMTMRNLAFAALLVIAIEPEQIAGASFQLSFAAVAALIAVQEARWRAAPPDLFAEPPPRAAPRPPWRGRAARAGQGVVHLLTATLFATLATASFMAAEFHELSPYVFIGNPLTLAMIEVFAVPGALLGTILYPLGLDAPVWHWVGWGIRIVLAVARILGAAPLSTVPLRDFAPWALPCLALALLSVVIWRSLLLRLTAVPLLALGLAGAASGARDDILVAATGDALALREPDGRLGTLGRPGAFTAEQWLRADGDARDLGGSGHGEVALPGRRCDKLGCVAPLPGGGFVSLVADAAAFAEDCRRARIVVTTLVAPRPCAAPVVIDRLALAASGAVALRRDGEGWRRRDARGIGEDRPWSPAPAPERRRAGRDAGAETAADAAAPDGGREP
ncbi:ComEC/Rec2 family competence protein [Lichenibacterium ramalinae]|uniref:ComEC family competence protein n=1 Tax=Lichenibacterium ramalinae TaxID=2316527 RepID=A0A4Q2R6Z6_9HYPH|nr:ComEC/Rec2 family competence protein [Lichenibacterium ramalinae]RYB02164.1 ComEC family competence protein [Lichenibacterium ramalinae]